MPSIRWLTQRFSLGSTFGTCSTPCGQSLLQLKSTSCCSDARLSSMRRGISTSSPSSDKKNWLVRTATGRIQENIISRTSRSFNKRSTGTIRAPDRPAPWPILFKTSPEFKKNRSVPPAATDRPVRRSLPTTSRTETRDVTASTTTRGAASATTPPPPPHLVPLQLHSVVYNRPV